MGRRVLNGQVGHRVGLPSITSHWIHPDSGSTIERIANELNPAYQSGVFEELISNPKGPRLRVERQVEKGVLQLTFRLQGELAHLLHWGVAAQQGGQWQAPEAGLRPAGSEARGTSAVQSPFQPGSEESRLVLRFPEASAPAYLVFDLFSPETNRWENNHGKDFWIRLTEPGPSPMAALAAHLPSGKDAAEVEKHRMALDGGGDLAVVIQRAEEAVRVTLVTDASGPLLLHWGLQDRARSRWKRPATNQSPKDTVDYDETAVRTPFEERDRLRWLTLSFSTPKVPAGMGFILFQPETGRLLKHRGADLFIKLAETTQAGAPLSELMARIVEGEMGPHGWTLMHRFNLCHELIGEAGDDRAAWATLFVWLRYSAIRQLDWQRNYNTKPRELSHAQERLTAKLAESFVGHPVQRDLIRLMLGCLGRGGDGQRIRDDILHIMHRHHIKEVGGTWMEQWHQKLHNNTTPDDIVICEAYLSFLRGNGDLGAYDHKLVEGGVTRERLAGFERPITRNPEWHPHLKDGLIHDFENYLKLLRSVHSGTDLETAANTGGYLLDGGAGDALGFVKWHFGNPHVNALELTGKITEVRRHLTGVLAHEANPSRVRDGMYLDLALEEALRTVIERQLHSGFDGGTLLALIGLVLENLRFVQADAELEQCARELARLPGENRFSPDWSLRAKAGVDRLRRAVEGVTDQTYQLLQPKAEALGREFEADDWTVQLFSEEIVRGRPVFVLSMLLHHLDPVLRKSAQLGNWQVISPSRAAGEVKVVEELRSLQGKKLERPTVIVADKVHGDEEPPEGVCAVLTPRSVDLVSHVAVRARNASLLFATCFDTETFEQLKKLDGRHVELTVTSSGDVRFGEASQATADQAIRKRSAPPAVKLPKPSLRVLRRGEFERSLVGGKSWRIREMAEKLGGSFQTPRSVALPFGVFDAVLADKSNQKSARRFQSLLQELDKASEAKLAELRDCVLGLELPGKLLANLDDAMRAEGFNAGQASRPAANSSGLAQGEVAANGAGSTAVDSAAGRMTGGTPVPLLATRIKQVWASLWNDRAYFSREANGLPHDRISMAVLIQEVVEAEYAFVIHTVNPATGNKEEIYAEVVRGLGETLVGNYPGRALSFVARKSNGKPTVLAYPSKSVALQGSGLIFRSDSNVEDLEGYAGAGLYDSVLLDAAREVRLDYTRDPLVWDAAFQGRLFAGIAKLGCGVEQAFGGAQDIEGVWVRGEFHVVQTRPQVGVE